MIGLLSLGQDDNEESTRIYVREARSKRSKKYYTWLLRQFKTCDEGQSAIQFYTLQIATVVNECRLLY